MSAGPQTQPRKLEAELPQFTLSVVITQWGKPDWLEACIRAIARQTTPENQDHFEVVVGDDGVRTAQHGAPLGGVSEQETQQAIRRGLAINGEFPPTVRYRRWAEDLPKHTLWNLSRTLPCTRGKWVWVLGNNDLLFNGALQRILKVLEKEVRGHGLVYTNYHGYHTPAGASPPSYPEHINATERWNLFPADTQFPNMAELATLEPHGFTPIYCSVMRREDWYSIRSIFLDNVAKKVRWEDPEVTCPYLVHILDYLMDRPVYYISKPMLLMNYDSTWKAEPGNEKWRTLLNRMKDRLWARAKEISR